MPKTNAARALGRTQASRLGIDMLRKFPDLPSAMAYASSCACMWSWVDGRPYPLWWMVESLKSDLHVIAHITSAAGKVAPMTWVGYARNECPGDTASLIRMALCRPESFFSRCYELRGWSLSKVHAKRRHLYQFKPRERSEDKQPELF